ncbi:MAG: HigA family addiction module antidote protein [Gammaproteobacteria bacterium]|nr:HigA family addiction module antidote protein [Gammaproteobacteria bacterium]
MKMYNPPHAGEVLHGLYIEPMGLTITETAKALGITRAALSEIINGKRRVTPKVAIKISKAFGGCAESWLNTQSKYDLWKAEKEYKADDVAELFASSVTA